MPIIFNKSIEDFNENCAAVIGCSLHNHECGSLHPSSRYTQNTDSFYFIDEQERLKPDAVFDITGELPEAFVNRFQLTLLENLPYHAYNDSEMGFKNALNMTRSDGYILITGCPRLKTHRLAFEKNKHLKYIDDPRHKPLVTYRDFDSVPPRGFILIPKNQNLTEKELFEKLGELPAPLLRTLKKAAPILFSDYKEKIAYANVDFDSLPTIYDLHVKDQAEQEAKQNKKSGADNSQCRIC